MICGRCFLIRRLSNVSGLLTCSTNNGPHTAYEPMRVSDGDVPKRSPERRKENRVEGRKSRRITGSDILLLPSWLRLFCCHFLVYPSNVVISPEDNCLSISGSWCCSCDNRGCTSYVVGKQSTLQLVLFFG